MNMFLIYVLKIIQETHKKKPHTKPSRYTQNIKRSSSEFIKDHRQTNATLGPIPRTVLRLIYCSILAPNNKIYEVFDTVTGFYGDD